MEAFWYALYATGGRVLSTWLRTPRVQKIFALVSGAVFMGFGGMLLMARV
ncbi:LysE family transporter [Komagataeibacter rhaeticus]|nr:LysE family transporter [Komagataeibacter rhaeticus]